MNCQECGKELEEGTNFCPECGADVNDKNEGRSNYLTSAGILTIISACYCALIGIFFIFRFVEVQPAHYGPNTIAVLLLTVIAFAGFSFGLTGGILTLKRSYLPLVIIGLVLIMATAVSLLFNGLGAFIIFGSPLLILTILSLIFTGIRNNEFS